VGICAIDAASGRLDYAGIGNTTMRRFGKAETRLVSQDGVLGQNMRTPLHQTLQLEPGDLVVLYTDGVSDRFTADDYPGVLRHAPKEVASNIVQRFGKDHDDAACIAVRYNA
jgi:serine phosphatase RsbU (regulator of sigma subunit)